MKNITITRARTHNLQNINLTIPRDKLIIITGPSGSGKSSLAFDTLYAEGQRRYVESLSSYARQFLSMMDKPDVDHIEGLSPAIAIEQKSTSHNPRSTVGTVTEIYDYMRLLFARAGEPHCPRHGNTLNAQTVPEMVKAVLTLPPESKIMIAAPVICERKGEYKKLLSDYAKQGFLRARIDNEIVELPPEINLAAHKKHNIDIIVDRLKVKQEAKLRITESIETALRLSDGLLYIVDMDNITNNLQQFSANYSCPTCGYSIPKLEPAMFSFNNPKGACKTCDGLGQEIFFDPAKIIINNNLSLNQGAIRGFDKRHRYYHNLLVSLSKHFKFSMDTAYTKLTPNIKEILLYGTDENITFTHYNDKQQAIVRQYPFEGIIPNIERRYHETDSDDVRQELSKYLSTAPCKDCGGCRLNEAARHVFLGEWQLNKLCSMTITKLYETLNNLQLSGNKAAIANKIKIEIITRLEFLNDVGLDYLSLERSADTLSGGEAQRIRLASQIGAGLVGVLYILDEPSIGLHQRDNDRLMKTLIRLRDLGNTVIVIEHDEEFMLAADEIVDMGPGAGIHGGQVVAQGDIKAICNNPESITGQYLSGKKTIAVPQKRTPANLNNAITVNNATAHNLKNVTATFPLGVMICVTGVSGSGKSTLVNDTLFPATACELDDEYKIKPLAHQGITGCENVDKIIDIDQSPIGRTPRSNPATYTGLFTIIRELFAATPEARARGYKAGRFSFNVKGGRCEACKGDGVMKVEMHFLPDIYVPCDVCKGQRYNSDTLDIKYNKKSILDVLNLTIEQASKFFQQIPMLTRKFATLIDIGLGYITLGQNALTLSGGEAQRIKLAKELSKRQTGKTLYILDEPTTGLHFHDISLLLKVLQRLKSFGNTIIIIEHNLDVIKTADWIIDLGPEGGQNGGEIIASGTPETIARNKHSYTGHYLKKYLAIKKEPRSDS